MVEWTWCHCWVPLQGAVDVVPLLGAFVGCHCSVLYGWGEGDDQLWGAIAGSVRWLSSVRWLGGRVTTNFGGVDVTTNFGGMDVVPGWDCSVLWLGGRVTTNFGEVDVLPLAEWTWCHCRVVTTNFGGVDVVPLMGAVVVCYGGGGTTNFGGVDVVPLITQKLVFAIWGLCWYKFFLKITMLSVWGSFVSPPLQRLWILVVSDLGKRWEGIHRGKHPKLIILKVGLPFCCCPLHRRLSWNFVAQKNVRWYWRSQAGRGN